MTLLTSKNDLKSILLILLGTFLVAFGLYNFNYQNDITEGGILGLLLFIKNVFGLSPSISSLILDLSLFTLGMKHFGKRFLFLSIFSIFCFSTYYGILEQYPASFPPFENFLVFASIFGGLFVGMGAGLIILAGGALSGDDVIALIISKHTPLKMNHVYLIIDFCVLSLSLIYIEPNRLIYSLIAVVISGKIISLFNNSSKS